MDLPPVLHLADPSSWVSGRATALVSASGRTRPVVLQAGAPADLPALTRRVRVRRHWPVAVGLRAARTVLVHAHDPAQAATARLLASGRPWTVTATRTTAATEVEGAALVLVAHEAERQRLLDGGVPTRVLAVHGLGPDPEPGALAAVLEAHWISLLATGRPAELARSARDLPAVTVLLATYQRRDLLLRCLEHLAAQTYPKHLVQVVVVDNGSTDGTAEALAAAGVEVVTTGEPLLVTEARNRGLARATGELVVFTDDDCRAVPGWLDNLVTTWLAAGQGTVQGRTTGDPTQPREARSRTQETPFGYGLFETCNIGYPRAALGQAPFDDAVLVRLRQIMGKHAPRDGGEDADLGWRVRKQGVPFCFTTTALVHHEVSPPDPVYQRRRARMTAVFPVLVQRHPELRRSFLVGRVFLHRERPQWWCAAATPVAVAVWGLPGLAAALPYGWVLLRPDRPGLRSRVKGLPEALRLDALTSKALVTASVRTRSVVL